MMGLVLPNPGTTIKVPDISSAKKRIDEAMLANLA
jgi:hypothetical protein